jgi:hypothetical protein
VLAADDWLRTISNDPTLSKEVRTVPLSARWSAEFNWAKTAFAELVHVTRLTRIAITSNQYLSHLARLLRTAVAVDQCEFGASCRRGP